MLGTARNMHFLLSKEATHLSRSSPASEYALGFRQSAAASPDQHGTKALGPGWGQPGHQPLSCTVQHGWQCERCKTWVQQKLVGTAQWRILSNLAQGALHILSTSSGRKRQFGALAK